MFIPIDRRDFLRHAAALGIALPLAGFDRAAAAEADLVARKVFFDNPDVGSVRISPDGATLAWLAPIGGVRNLFVAPLADPAAARAVTHATDRNLSTYFRWAHTNRHLVFFQERDGDENWRASSVDLGSGAIVPLTPERGVKAYWQEADRKFPEEMLFKHNARDKRYFDLFRVNLVTGKSDLLFENNEFAWYVTDSDFRLRLGVRFAADGSAENMLRRPDGTWEHFLTVPIGDLDSTQALDFSADGKTLYVLDTRDRDKAALFAIDIATREPTLLAADDEADMAQVDFDFVQRRPLAARANRDRVRWHAVDPSAAQDLADLASYGPGDVEIIERSADNRFATVFYERDTESGEFALLDRQTRKVRGLFRQRTALAGVALRKMQPVIIPARDGLRLNGYLTLPGAEAGAGKLPMVLLIHGGPESASTVKFSPLPQLLAAAGFIVFQPNYRGSTNLGDAYQHAIFRDTGAGPGNDVMAGVAAVERLGIVDQDRVGVSGWSYGGYMTAWLTGHYPLWKAAVSGAALTDWVMDYTVAYYQEGDAYFFGGSPWTAKYRGIWREQSPINYAQNVTAPTLIMGDVGDPNVPLVNSYEWYHALRDAGVEVEFYAYPADTHFPKDIVRTTDVYRRWVAWMSRRLK